MNSKTRFMVIAATALSLIVAIGWIAALRRPAPRGDSSTHELTDMTGKTIHAPVSPARILSLCTLATDTIICLGATDRLVAIDEFSNVVPGSLNTAIIGKGSDISREKVVSLRIDLAFVWWYQDDAAKLLLDLGIPTLRIRSGRASELPDAIRLIGKTLNLQDEAEHKAREIESFLAGAKTRSGSASPRVFLELYGPLKTAGRGTYANDLLELAGAINIAGDAEGNFVFSAEKLVQSDPDALLCIGNPSDAQAFARRPGIADLRAVHNGRVIPLDRYWLVAGPNLPQSVEKIRAALMQKPNP